MKRVWMAMCVMAGAVLPLSANAEVSATGAGLQGKPLLTDLPADRQARYSDGNVNYLQGQFGVQKLGQDATVHVDVRADKLTDFRSDVVQTSQRASAFRLYDARRTLLADVDGDGYHRRFKIRFDADVSYGSAKVYAKLYLRRVGDSGAWRRYFTTDDFWINGSSGSDEYFVETTLTDGFGTGQYDVLIDLFEVGYSGTVATLGPFEDRALRDLPLEDVGLDVPVANKGYSLNAAKTYLLADDDGDGFHHKFRVEFDPDRDFGTSVVYAVLWVRLPGGNWIKDYTTQNFEVHESGTEDMYRIDANWQSGYAPAKYDMQIDLMDAATHLLVATASSERPELSRVPLEDAVNDKKYTSGNGAGSGGDTSSREGGGGSNSLTALLLLGVLALVQIWRRRQTLREQLMQQRPLSRTWVRF